MSNRTQIDEDSMEVPEVIKPEFNKYPVGIDADIISYRCAFSAKDGTQDDAIEKVNELVDSILDKVAGTWPDENLITYYLTGKNNFRYEVAKSFPYKGNRSTVEKPEHLNFIRDYLVEQYGAFVVHGKEADDELATQASRNRYNYIIASTDKDFLQVPCWIYNWGRDTWVKPDEYSAHKALYIQMLTGDRSDNIVGLHQIGPVRAESILEGSTTEEEMYDAVLKAYDGDSERVEENARLLFLQRYPGQMWKPPMERGRGRK